MRYTLTLLAALMVSIVTTSISQAEQFRRAGDLFAADDTVTLNGEPANDVFAAGESVSLQQATNRNAYAAGRRVDLIGPITGDAYAAGYSVTTSNTIAGRAYLAGYEVIIGSTSTIGEGARLAGRKITIDGTINGTAVIFADSVSITGTVNGDVIIQADDLSMDPSASITGNLTFQSDDDADVPEDGVSGTITQTSDPGAEDASILQSFQQTTTGQVVQRGANSFFVFGQLVAGIIIFVGFPGLASRLRSTLEQKGFGNLFGGILALIVALGSIIVASITIIGIPIAILLALAVPFVLMLGYAIGAVGWLLLVAKAISRQIPQSAWARLLLALVAVIPVYVLGSVPYIGWLITLGTVLLGLGALFTVFRTRNTAIV